MVKTKYTRSSEKQAEYGRIYRAKNRAVLAARAREYRRKYPEKVKEINRRNRTKQRRANRKCYRDRRASAVMGYGGKCVCCGESNLCFLTIDHVNNDGRQHRKKGGHGSGSQLYRWIIRNGFPEGMFQVLCYNCNCAKQHDPIGHRAAHPNARLIDGLGEIDTSNPEPRFAPSSHLRTR